MLKISQTKENLQTKEFEKELSRLKGDFKRIYEDGSQNIDSIFNQVHQTVISSKCSSLDEYNRRMTIELLKTLAKLIKFDELNHRSFNIENLKKDEFWAKLKKIILAKRIEELKSCKISKKGKKIDISELKCTYLGMFIVKNLGFERRTILEESEYDTIRAQIRKLKYEVPVTIEPTKTEKFFSK